MDLFKTIFRLIILNWYYITRKRKEKNVYFSSFEGQYSDSPKAIAEELYRLDPSIHQLWCANKGVNMPEYVEKVFSPMGKLRARAISKAWVIGMGSNWKPKDILLVAVWHGDRGFKKILLETPTKSSHTRRGKNIIKSSRNIDIFTSGSRYGEMQAHQGLGYYGYIQKEGLPRNDKLVNAICYKEDILKIKAELGISLDTKILLYAPTFRDSETGKQKSTIDIPKAMNSLQKNGEKWICILRAHKLSKGIETCDTNAYLDLSDWGDMTDLLLISDCLITDYSSCAGDFILTNKPCILAHFDKEEYEAKSRSLWINPDETGFLIAKNQKELNNLLEHLYDYDHASIANNVLNYYGAYESGKSAKVTAQKIADWVNK